MTPVTRVFIVAPTLMIQAGLRSMLASAESSDVRVVGEAVLTTEASPELSEADVLLVADEDLLEEVAGAVGDDGTQALLLLAEDDRPVARLRILPLRGWGIVPPDAPPEELVAALTTVTQGLIVLPKSLTERLLQTPAVIEELSEPLTTREREVLELLGRGLSNRLIARELYISEHTVKFHISSLYAKLGVNNRAEAVSQGARRGLISL